MYDRVCVTVVRVCMTALRIGQRGSTLCVREIGTLLFQEPHTRPKAGGTHRKALLARQSKAEGLVATEQSPLDKKKLLFHRPVRGALFHTLFSPQNQTSLCRARV